MISLWHSEKRPFLFIRTKLSAEEDWTWCIYWNELIKSNQEWENSITLNTEAFCEIPAIPMKEFEETPLKYLEEAIPDNTYEDRSDDIRICYRLTEKALSWYTTNGLKIEVKPGRPTLLIWDGRRTVYLDYKILRRFKKDNPLVLTNRWNDLLRYILTRGSENTPSPQTGRTLREIVTGKSKRDNSAKRRAIAERDLIERQLRNPENNTSPDMSPQALLPGQHSRFKK